MRKADRDCNATSPLDKAGIAALDRWAAITVLNNPQYLEDTAALRAQAEAFMGTMVDRISQMIRMEAQNASIGLQNSLPKNTYDFLASTLGRMIVEMAEVEISRYIAKSGMSREETEYAILRTVATLHEMNM